MRRAETHTPRPDTADSSDHVPSAQAIAKGLAAGHTAGHPGTWLHVCGTGLLMWYDEAHGRVGEAPAPGESYDDVADIDRIVSLPDAAFHRAVDKVVLSAAAAAAPAVRVAIVGPPTIYGVGRGPANRRSRQVYGLAAWTLQHGFAPVIGAGRAEWDNVHIHDVSDLLVRLVDAALDGARRADERLFGPRAYYFCETGAPHRWAEVAAWIAEEAHRQGYLEAAATRKVDPAEGPKDRSLGYNSKSVASRARTLLGWKPTGRSLKEEIPDVVAGEAEILGLKPRQ